jgi:hypothetical protein
MHIFIPLWVLYIPVVYLAIGIVLYVPMCFWSFRVIAKGKWSWKRQIFNPEIFLSWLAWPYIAYTLTRMEMRRYRKSR